MAQVIRIFSLLIGMVILSAAVVGCSPFSLTRIGPVMPPRAGDCQIEILAPTEKPSRPYRDIGMVALKQCQDYRVPPCRNWLIEAACELGGQVAYLQDEERPESEIGPVTYQVFVGVYLGDEVRGTLKQPGGVDADEDCEEQAEKMEENPDELGGRCLD